MSAQRWQSVAAGLAAFVALHEPELLHVLRWLRPSARPVIEIGTNSEVRPKP